MKTYSEEPVSMKLTNTFTIKLHRHNLICKIPNQHYQKNKEWKLWTDMLNTLHLKIPILNTES